MPTATDENKVTSLNCGVTNPIDAYFTTNDSGSSTAIVHTDEPNKTGVVVYMRMSSSE